MDVGGNCLTTKLHQKPTDTGVATVKPRGVEHGRTLHNADNLHVRK